jgi:hypothetical protein
MRSVVAEGEGNVMGQREGGGRGRGRLEELLRQAGAWQVMKARRRGDGPWTLHS